jgi:hypothetical protein
MSIPGLAAEEGTIGAGEPAWVFYEKGLSEMYRKDYGSALYYFQQALSRQRVMPEAEVAIGDVYFFQGDYPLAERQYNRAMEMKAAFTLPNFTYEISYRLARLYKNQSNWGPMYRTLLSITKDDTMFGSAQYKLFRDKTRELYRNKGFDVMFAFNRIDETFATRAHAQLAEYYYRTWNFEVALDDALFSVIPVLTESMKEIRNSKPEYQYTTLKDFLATGLGISSVRQYLDEQEFWRRLYYFALISYEKIDIRDNGRFLLGILAATPAAGAYQGKAASQLSRPTREPRLDAPRIEM